MATGCKRIFDKARDEHVAQLVRGESVRGPQDQPPVQARCAVPICSASDFIAWLNSPESREHHRREYTDLEWASRQPKGPPKYKVGDVVEFYVGGFGVINKVSEPNNGWPSSYATDEIEGMADRRDTKRAWHYEGDFKTWVAKSPLHSLPNIPVSNAHTNTEKLSDHE